MNGASRKKEVRALILKNIYIIRRRKFESLMQILWPLGIIAVFNILMWIIKQFNADKSFFEYFGETFLQMSVLPMLTGNIMLFAVKQTVSEKESGVLRSLILMNCRGSSNIIAMWITQQPLCIITALLISILYIPFFHQD